MKKVLVSQRYIAKAFAPYFAKKVVPAVSRSMKREIVHAEAEIIERFLTHAITEEIQSGPYGTNTSGLLNGYGNLYSFLGFEAGTDPVKSVVSFLSKSIKAITVSPSRNSLAVKITIVMPSRRDWKYLEQLPWISKGWIEAIERGISGLGAYLHDSDDGFEASRSETGLEVRKNISSRYLQGQSYLTDIVQDVTRKLVLSIRSNLIQSVSKLK